MNTRTVAFLEWAVAALLIVWFVVLQQSTQVADPVSWTLGIVISSTFVAGGLVISLGINGGVHFRRRPLARAEAILLGVQALLLVLLVVAGIFDQIEFARILNTSVGSSLGHWLDWFVPLWLLLVPVALTVLILALINRSRGRSAPPAPTP
jgi:hypothetical protein